MKIDVLASGSKGNMYALASSNQTLLLECGIKPSEAVRKHDDIQGCLVTHEHNDHARYTLQMTRQYCIDVYCSQGTADNIKATPHRVHVVRHRKKFTLGAFEILPFNVHHDAKEPFGYLIRDTKTGEKTVFATDTFYLDYTFRGLNYIMVESNYDFEMLRESVESDVTASEQCKRLTETHMSFDNSLRFILSNDLSGVKEIHLLHLSRNHADPKIFVEKVKEKTGGLIDVYAW